MFVSNNSVSTKERRLAFFLRIFDINSVFWLSESLAILKLMSSDVCRNAKTQEQLNGSMDYVEQSNTIYVWEETRTHNHLACKATFIQFD